MIQASGELYKTEKCIKLIFSLMQKTTLAMDFRNAAYPSSELHGTSERESKRANSSEKGRNSTKLIADTRVPVLHIKQLMYACSFLLLSLFVVVVVVDVVLRK